MNDETTPEQVLDHYLFHNVFNAYLPGSLDEHWAVTWEGDNYVVLNKDTFELTHFEVQLVRKDWDSKQAMIDQEWDYEYGLNLGRSTYLDD